MTNENQKTSTPNKDQFTEFKKDPRLESAIYKQGAFKTKKKQHQDLISQWAKLDIEEFADAIRQYKYKTKQELITQLENKPFENRQKILESLSDTAELLTMASLERAEQLQIEKFGEPLYLSSYKQMQRSHLALVAMGKLATREINYFSDLDVIFIFSHRGETAGTKEPGNQIKNTQFFIRVAQRFISMMTLLTSRGRCYQIDTELRPSGNQGTLVTSFDYFLDHQMNKAAYWERMALTRSRAISQDCEFEEALTKQIDELVYHRPLPQDFAVVMNDIRQKVLRERAKTKDDYFDLKLGQGGIMDIEFTLQLIQLKFGRLYPQLRRKSVFEILKALKEHSLLSNTELKNLTQAYVLFRSIESKLHLEKRRSFHVISLKESDNTNLAEQLQLSEKQLISDIKDARSTVQSLYRKFYESIS
ncbi:MAG: hypothetical protein H7A33_04525 [Deltaproteobacteria bacterium]|nr:hypothetical protein [Deltaproteobacteria bacterium]